MEADKQGTTMNCLGIPGRGEGVMEGIGGEHKVMLHLSNKARCRVEEKIAF